MFKINPDDDDSNDGECNQDVEKLYTLTVSVYTRKKAQTRSGLSKTI